MKLSRTPDGYTIEGIAGDELWALYQAVLHTPLPYRGGAIYKLKTQIEDKYEQNCDGEGIEG